MAYKSILTVITRAEGMKPTLAAAASLARQWDAHLDVLILGVDKMQIGYGYLGAGEVIIQAGMQRVEDDARLLSTAAATALTAEAPGMRCAIETVVTQLGVLSDVIARHARFADLVILARPYGAGRGSEDEAVVEAAMFQGNVPVLILPDKELKAPIGRRVLLGWDQSPEAMRATRAAMPLLKQADKVDITVVDPPTHGPERSDPGGPLCQMLVRHGVKAEVSVLAKTMPRISDVLARHVWDVDADLIVMGAYGHSRLRESVLGGATRAMLEKAEVPVLMMH